MARVDRIIRRNGIKQRLAVMDKAAYNMFQHGYKCGLAEGEANAAKVVSDRGATDGGDSAPSNGLEYCNPHCDGTSGHDPEAGSFPSS